MVLNLEALGKLKIVAEKIWRKGARVLSQYQCIEMNKVLRKQHLFNIFNSKVKVKIEVKIK